MQDYWKNEPDQEIDTGKNVLRYYAEARRLQVCMPYWTDNDGNRKPGKTVSLNLDALAETPEAIQLLEKVLSNIKQ